jgi:hypothetical protein
MVRGCWQKAIFNLLVAVVGVSRYIYIFLPLC